MISVMLIMAGTILFLAIVVVVLSSVSETCNEILFPERINEANLKTLIEEVGLGEASFVSHNNSCATILDEKQDEIHIIYSVEQNHNKIHSYQCRTVKFSEIISSELIIDSSTITSTSRGSQVAGGVIGGLALGGVGAIVGGLSGKTRSVENAKYMDIKLTLNSLSAPICKINFLDGEDFRHRRVKEGFEKESEEYKYAITEAEKWQGIFDIILQNRITSN